MKELDEKYLAKLRTYWKRHAAFPSMGKRANDVTQTSDVTRELWEEHLRLTAGDQAQPD